MTQGGFINWLRGFLDCAGDELTTAQLKMLRDRVDQVEEAPAPAPVTYRAQPTPTPTPPPPEHILVQTPGGKAQPLGGLPQVVLLDE